MAATAKPCSGYSNPTQANADYTGPVGFNIGSRNNLRGPKYFDMDMGLGKNFPITERVRLTFRADAFNVFNHPNFDLPSTDITDSSVQFGVISEHGWHRDQTTARSAARVLQVALRLEF